MRMKVKPAKNKLEDGTGVFRDVSGNTFWNTKRLGIVEKILDANPIISLYELTEKLHKLFPERDFGVSAVKSVVRKMKNAKRVKEFGF